jgi:hypothetical protein
MEYILYVQFLKRQLLHTFSKYKEGIMNPGRIALFFLIVVAMPLSACSPKIYGTLQLVDKDMQPVEGESPEGMVVNMINTSERIEKASHSATVDSEGKFESEKGAITKGLYKVEVSRIGYLTETQDVEVGSMSSKKVEMKLKKIAEGKRRSIESSTSDEDKIINPGEVNIQPPMM